MEITNIPGVKLKMSCYNHVLKQHKKSVVKIGGIGVSDRKSSPIKQWQTWSKSAETVIIWERMALKLGTQHQPGICEPTILLIQEHGLFNH